MKIVNIKGGLGNQMFQYAFALALKNKFPDEKIFIDTQHYKFPFLKTFRGNNFHHNGYEINTIFPNCQIPTASWLDIAKHSYYIPNYVISRALRKVLPHRKKEFVQSSSLAYLYDASVFESADYSYYDGYWLSPNYFDFCKDDILNAFEFQSFDTIYNIELANSIRSNNSIAIHIRRGDYLNNPIYKGICTFDYLKSAVNKAKNIIKNPIYFIFSNDIVWCSENLKIIFGKSPVLYVTNNKGTSSYKDMQLMSLARCNIIANSSFSWWGAYLNKRSDHLVFCPHKWVNAPCEDACCKDWIKI